MRYFFVINLFCVILECKIHFAARFSFQIYFALSWSAKFILRYFFVILECKIYFALFFRSKFILRYLGVQNLFCVIFSFQIYFASARFSNLFCVGAIYFATAIFVLSVYRKSIQYKRFYVVKWWASGRKYWGKKRIFDGPLTHPTKSIKKVFDILII
ncbi:MAG: hypothetical protein DRQ99_29260 [Candidatus Parabeggiatoa sp. nov. 3]|nr:MAG: hypothetical protein DRQ99_29260 [Gammaproteobacteria bacterium]